MLTHAVATEDFFNKPLLELLFKRADEFAAMDPVDYPKPLSHKTVATLFFEPSTRTRLSFETAIQNLGGQLITVDNASEFSSAKKGETLEDTIQTINAYAEGIVIRHPEVGSAKRAAAVSNAHVVNAGDGAGDHPTQGLLDVYTMAKDGVDLKGKKVMVVGDLLNGRTLHSTLQLLILYEAEILLVAPPSLRLPRKYLDLFDKYKISYTQLDNWSNTIAEADVLYMTRIQQERFASQADYDAVKDSFRLTMDDVRHMKSEAVILHPLPRVNEIDPAVDSDPRAQYFNQVKNGLYVRMALLEHLFTN